MTQRQVEIADQVLRLMAADNKVWYEKDVRKRLGGLADDYLADFSYTMGRLVADGLLSYYLYSRDNYVITHRGEQAARCGIVRYFENKEGKERTNEWRSKWSFILLVVSILISVIALITSCR